MRTLFLALCFSALATACSASHSEDAATAPFSLPLTLGSVTSITGALVIVARHEGKVCFSLPTDLVCFTDAQLEAALAGRRVSPLK